ncbi:hypothetical protein M5X02_31040, partial [Paenibacillus alvei]|nr:hypothetical protein [Paenibacillus alvei]
QDYSHLFISDSLSSKLMDLIESVETEVPGAKEEIFRKADINGVSIQANEIDFQKFYRILAVVLPLLFAIMSHHDAVASSEQSRQQHQEITNQFDKKFQELFELIKSVASNPKPDQSSETKIPEEHSYPSKNPCSTGRIDD